MTLSECSMCIIPYQGIGSPLCSLFLIRLLSGAQGRGWRGCILVPHILQSKKPDPIEKTGHTIRSRYACVWNFLDGTRTPFYMTLSFILRYELSFFFSFFFPCFLGTGIFFCFFFGIAHILFTIWRVMPKGWSIFGEWEACFLRNFHCRSQHMSGQVGESR